MQQQMEDYEKARSRLPVQPSGASWDLCSEVRPTSTDRLVLGAETPTAVLVGQSSSECAHGVLQPLLQRLEYRVTVTSRELLVASLIFFGIVIQWSLVGYYLDRRRGKSELLRPWSVPVAIITATGILMAPATFFPTLEPIDDIGGLVASLTWAVLILMFFSSGIAWSIRAIRRRRTEVAGLHR